MTRYVALMDGRKAEREARCRKAVVGRNKRSALRRPIFDRGAAPASGGFRTGAAQCATLIAPYGPCYFLKPLRSSLPSRKA